jgi:hypothetical protein
MLANRSGRMRVGVAVTSMHNISDVLSLYAEISIAIAGFTGVSASFAGRDRMFRPTERTRLHAVLLNSSSVFGGCLGYYSASSAGLSVTTACAVAATVSFLLTVPLIVFVIPAGWRHHKDPDSTTETWFLYVVTVYGLSLLVLYSIAATQVSGQHVLVIAFSLQMLFALWMFFRLLTRPN